MVDRSHDHARLPGGPLAVSARRARIAGAALLALVALPSSITATIDDGLVGHWNFNGTAAGPGLTLVPEQLHSLGAGAACLQLDPARGAVSIPIPAGSALALARGTICFWLNVGERATGTVFEYDNRAVQMNVYRSHFQPRFRGTGNFSFGNTMLGPDWPRFELRESAFYPHERAVTGEGEWHHFAVAYDDRARVIRGWRDGSPIASVDLSSVAMTPLRQDGLKAIVLGREFPGFLDELRIYNRPLDNAEVAQIHAAEQATYAGRADAVAVNRQLHVYSYRDEDRALYRAWLQNRPLAAPSSPLPLVLVASERDPTIANAAREVRNALGEMTGAVVQTVAEDRAGARIILGTPASSAWIALRSDILGLGSIQHDGYVVRALPDPAGPVVVVAAHVPAGVVFGAFELLRQLQLGADPAKLDLVSSPTVPLRLVNHWDVWRGFPHDDWRGEEAEDAEADGNRTNSIFSWAELRRGDTRRVRDWARLLASAGWNAICPTEINWEFRNNFLDHLDEVKVLAGIFREYGIRIFWSPNYLLALRPETAERLYAAVPDFGGYLLKLGSEAQEGDPRPAMVNRIADCLKPHGGQALVRAFVYGKYRYSPDDLRNLNPYDVIAPEDGHYRDNVVIISKGSPLDWDFSAPIPPLDGAIQRNSYGSELVIAKSWPLSWVEKWKWWLEQDNYRRSAGSLNKRDVRCILGVAMIHPAPGWTSCPLNMVNYYGLGRLAQNPELTVDEIYTEWIRLTYGEDPNVLGTVKTILRLSDDATRKLTIYRGYRGVWMDRRRTDLVQNKTPHTLTTAGIGPATPALRDRVLAQYAPGLRAIYGDLARGEEFFASFNFAPLDHRLSIGRTVIQDLFANLDEAVDLATEMPRLWRTLAGRIDTRRFEATLETLDAFARTAKEERDSWTNAIEAVTKRTHAATMAELAPANRATTRLFSIVDFGARGNGTGDQASSINTAIEAAHAAGGGTVFVPSGIFVIGGPIELRSGVTLALDTGAVLEPVVGVRDVKIVGSDLENVTVLGPGMLANATVALNGCRRVLVRNLHVAAPQLRGTAVLARSCREITFDNVTIESAGDGMDFDGSRDVVVANCHVTTARTANGRRLPGGVPLKVGALAIDGARESLGISVRDCMLADR